MKKSVTMITLLLLIAGMLSGCGDDSNGNRQDESVQTAEPTTKTEYEEPTTEPEAEETQPKFDVTQDVLLSYEYDSTGELSKVIFTYDLAFNHHVTDDDIWEFKNFNVTYDTNGYLKSIQSEEIDKFRVGTMSIKSDYNTDGQIISLTITRTRYGVKGTFKYNYEVVYNSLDDCIKVYISNQKDSDASEVNETRTYDSNCNLISIEWFDTSSDRIIRIYDEYVNGILSHQYRYNDSTGRLLSEFIYYDNGNLSERYSYDEETGKIEYHNRYDRNGDLIR